MAGTDYIEGGVEKMKRAGRKLIGMAAAWLLAASAFSTAVYAADGFSSEYERLLDTANILSDEEQDEITELLDELSERQRMDVTIATVENLDGYNSIEACADDLYDYCNFGYGTDRDGLMFVVSMEEREWHISTCGYGITAFTDAGIQYVGGQMLDSLADGDYAQAFRIYAACCDDLIDQARAGHPFDKGDVAEKTHVCDSSAYLYCNRCSSWICSCPGHEGTAKERSQSGISSQLCTAWQHESDRETGSFPVQPC